MNLIATAALLASLVVLQTPTLAQTDGPAQLQLTVVDQNNAALSNAVVTVYTMYGPRTVSTDAKGVAVLAGLPAAMTQWWARMPGHHSSADAARLKPGKNTQTVTLHNANSQSGS